MDDVILVDIDYAKLNPSISQNLNSSELADLAGA